MTVERARVIKASSLGPSVIGATGATGAIGATGATTRQAPSSVTHARVVPRVVVDAHGEASRIVAAARADADRIVAGATAGVAATVAANILDAREREIARVTAEILVARSGEEHAAARTLDRTIEIARVLAERLVGEAIAVQPERVASLATVALEETRGARQMRIEACPEDVAVVQDLLASLGAAMIATVESSPELSRGSLIVQTDLGRIDARLAPQLERLAEALRPVLHAASIEGGRGSTPA